MLGYFPIKSINDSLGVKKYIDLMQTVSGFHFSLFSLLSALIYARTVQPCSKRKTAGEVFPKLFEKCDFSLGQIYDGLEFTGCEYEKIIEIYNHQIRKFFNYDASCTFSTAPIFSSKLTGRMGSERKARQKKTGMIRLWGWGFCLTLTRYRSG